MSSQASATFKCTSSKGQETRITEKVSNPYLHQLLGLPSTLWCRLAEKASHGSEEISPDRRIPVFAFFLSIEAPVVLIYPGTRVGILFPVLAAPRPATGAGPVVGSLKDFPQG